MKLQKLGILLAVIGIVAGLILYFNSGSVSPSNSATQSLEQSSSSLDEGSSEIQMPPENQFRKSQPRREIQSDEKMQDRRVPQSNRILKPSPAYNVDEMQLTSHEVLDGSAWQVWGKMKPLSKSELDQPASIEISQFAIVPDENSTQNLEEFNPQAPVPVFDSRRKVPGLITGTFVVTLRPEANPDILIADNDIRILQSFPEIHTYFVTSSVVPFSLTEFKLLLTQKGTIVNVETEVLSRNYAKF